MKKFIDELFFCIDHSLFFIDERYDGFLAQKGAQTHKMEFSFDGLYLILLWNYNFNCVKKTIPCLLFVASIEPFCSAIQDAPFL